MLCAPAKYRHRKHSVRRFAAVQLAWLEVESKADFFRLSISNGFRYMTGRCAVEMSVATASLMLLRLADVGDCRSEHALQLRQESTAGYQGGLVDGNWLCVSGTESQYEGSTLIFVTAQPAVRRCLVADVRFLRQLNVAR